jgi:glycerophosphoryl diester phosphodiesterase
MDGATSREPIVTLAAGAFGDLSRLIVPLAWFELVFKSVVASLSVAAASGLLAVLTRSTGSSAVTNTDIVEFLLSPVGVVVVVLLGLCSLLIAVMEHLGVMAILARYQRGQRITVSGLSGTLASLLIPLLKLKARGFAFLILTAAPLALLAALTYAALLSQHDINYYLANRPPSFLTAVGIGGVLGAIFLAILAYAYVRTVFIFPIILYEDQPAPVALRESLRRTNGAFRRLGTILLGWQLFGVGSSWVAVRGYTGLATILLGLGAARYWTLVPMVALLLAMHAVLLAVLSFLLVAIHCILILRLYRERNAAVGANAGDSAIGLRLSGLDAPRLASLLRYWKIAILASLAVFVTLCVGVLQQFAAPATIIVTAHKGFSAVAPENSLSAIRKAIEVGADYAEIDVQQTADGVVVLNHDRDLMRVAGVPRRISEMTLAEVRSADIGRTFSPEFAGEKVPTLAEVIALARDKIKVQIELKFYDRDRKLADTVARLIEREHFESQCVISSLHYDALQRVRRLNPRLRTAAIVTLAIGDIDRLDVDALSVNSRNLSKRLIRAAKARHKDLYAWTVDDPRQMVTLMERGVSNIVTNRPDLLIELRDEFARLSDAERRLLAARYLLGLAPALGTPSSEGAADDDQP